MENKNFKSFISVIIRALNVMGYLKWIPDQKYLTWRYSTKFNKKLNFENPQTYNEKLQWLKINNRDPKYTQLVDKYTVRKYVQEKIGSEYLVPLLNVWESVEEIDWKSLPDQFVLKCNHDSGGLIICTDKKQLDVNKAKKKLRKSLARNYYYAGREWPYKNVPPLILCEEFLSNPTGGEIQNYRIFCFNGKAEFIAVDFNTTDKNNTKRNIYDLEWNLLDFKISYPNEKKFDHSKPLMLNKMIELSEKLSDNIPHARIDFYYIEDQIIFGEITLFHQSGLGVIEPIEYEQKLGDLIDISGIKVK